MPSDTILLTTCDLCGLDCGPEPFSARFHDAEKSFCCLGCRNVFEILSESGVPGSDTDFRESDLFKQSLAMGLISRPDADQVRSAEKPKAEAWDGPMKETVLTVSGMWCSACAWLIENVLSSLPGVESVEVLFASDMVKVAYRPQCLPPENIVRKIEALGYRAGSATDGNDQAAEEKRDLLMRIGVAFFLWMNVMTLSVVLYVGWFEKISASFERNMPFVLAALASPVLFYSAQPIFRPAWRGLLNRTVRMESLLALGIFAAYVYSLAQAFRGETHVYFDTASAIVTLVLVGKFIERSAKEETSKSLLLLHRMMPRKARVLRDDRETFVSLDDLKIGDLCLVKPGERIPADGVVVEGMSHADESLLTGESRPVTKKPGDFTAGGSLNVGNALRIETLKIGKDSAISRIVSMVETALAGRSNLERTVDRISRVFVPGVTAVAVVTFLVCWLTGAAGFGDALLRAITVLVIACPCALGMATPLAVTTAIGTASRMGILVRESRVLETLPKIDAVVFDKTGTVTDGSFSLLEIRLRDGLLVSTSEALRMVASLETMSEHLLARAVTEFASGSGIPFLKPGEVETRKGEGIVGSVDGKRVFAGNRRLIESLGTGVDSELETSAVEHEREGRTTAFFGWDDRLAGLMVFGDQLKPEAPEVVGVLKEQGIKVHLVSGDSKPTTERTAKRIGADAFAAETSPEEKVRYVEGLKNAGLVVAMIGDGINDAPALARADLGIALGTGTDLARNAAAMTATGNSLRKIPDILRLAKFTRRVVTQNLFWAFFYNTVGIGLAVTGVLNPIAAAVAMLFSSVSVIANSRRLGSFGSGKA